MTDEDAIAADSWWHEWNALAACLAVSESKGWRQDDELPTMPRQAAKAQSHRPLLDPTDLPFPAMVTRLVSRSEAQSNPKAAEALRKEFAGLSAKCWDEKKRRSKADVMAEAKRTGVEVQFSAVHGIVGEKGSELPEGDPRRKHKGRRVLLGNRVFNQDLATATFSDLGKAPTLLEGARLTDAYGCIPGHSIQQADAVQAYIQAPMRGPKCWVTLPREAVQNPSFYYQVQSPVVELIVALCGHPDSPTFWEMHCSEQVKKAGFEALGPEWPSVFFHPQLRLLLSIYVDDFKLAGPIGNLDGGWELLRKLIEMEDPGPVGLYLGCQQRLMTIEHARGTVVEHDVSEVSNPQSPPQFPRSGGPAAKGEWAEVRRQKKKTAPIVNVMVYDMEAFLDQCVGLRYRAQPFRIRRSTIKRRALLWN